MEKINNFSTDYTCIFGGGAVRGVCYVGAVRALEELDINLKTIAGSSVGAVFGGLMAVGYTAEELAEVFMHINFELFRDIHFGFGKDFALSKGEVFLDWLRDLIEKKYYGDAYIKGENAPVTFADLDKDFVVIATDLTNFSFKEFSRTETPDFEVAYAIRISSSMPGLMKPIEENGALLVDGDLQKSWPLWRLTKSLCPDEERVLEFRLEGDYEGKGHSAVNFINTVYSCVTALATDFIVETYAHRDKFDYIIVNTGSVVVVDFALPQDKREELIEIGYQQTIEYFTSQLKDKKKELLSHYKTLLRYCKKIKKYINENKIKYARNELGNLYMNFYPMRRYIDLRYYDMIEDFKEKFLSSIIAAPLFGIYNLQNAKTIKAQIGIITSEVDKRVKELESYIDN